MATVTMYRATVPQWQGDKYIAVGDRFPEGAPEINNPDWFQAEFHDIPTKRRTKDDE